MPAPAFSRATRFASAALVSGRAGAINFLPGGGAGLVGGPVLHQDVAGIGSTAEEFDQFGYAVATPLPQGSGVAASGSSSSTTTARPAPGQ
jgi:hypothetical protein